MTLRPRSVVSRFSRRHSLRSSDCQKEYRRNWWKFCMSIIPLCVCRGMPSSPQRRWCLLGRRRWALAIWRTPWRNISGFPLENSLKRAEVRFCRRGRSRWHWGGRNCISWHRLHFYRGLDLSWSTFIEGVEADDFDFEIAIEGHLSENVVAEGGLSCGWAACHADDYFLGALFCKALLSAIDEIHAFRYNGSILPLWG